MMNLETVVDVVFKHFPNKIMIYSGYKLLFKGDLKDFIEITDFDHLIVDRYGYVDEENKTMKIRVLED